MPSSAPTAACWAAVGAEPSRIMSTSVLNPRTQLGRVNSTLRPSKLVNARRSTYQVAVLMRTSEPMLIP